MRTAGAGRGMRGRPTGRVALAAAVAVAGLARAQERTPGARADAPPATPFSGTELQILSGFFELRNLGDYTEIPMTGGTLVTWRDSGSLVEIRAQRGLLHADRDQTVLAIDGMRADGAGLPRQGPGAPPSKRVLDEDRLAERLRSFLTSTGRTPPEAMTQPREPGHRVALQLFRNLYVEGGVSVLRDGTEVIRAERLTLSPTDDRAVLEEATLRLVSRRSEQSPEIVYTVRGARIVKQGRRWLGTDLSVTTSRAGKPHFEVMSGQVEIIEEGDQFTIRSRANDLVIGGITVLPLPDASIRTGEQNQFLIQGASAGYSNQEGYNAEIELGSSFNGIGGAIHQALTGQSPDEFRGDWRARLGWIEQRGYPLGGDLTWRGGDTYDGQFEAFHLDDDGPNLREIQSYFDGDPVADRGRNLVRFSNRIHFSEETKLDLYGNWQSDPAVYSEFYRGEYREDEIPESGFDFRTRDSNRFLRLDGRWNLSDHSYNDARALAPRFVERLPQVRAGAFSEPLFETPWETPVVLTAVSEVGQWRSNFDDTFVGLRPDDRTVRVDQRVEVAAPVHWQGIGVRPFVGARFTHFDNTAAGGSDSRWALEAGVRAGTRLSRTWHWFDEEGDRIGLRHVILPNVSFVNRWHVSGDPADFYQFDATDALDEDTQIRVGALNVLQGMFGPEDERGIGTAAWLDLQQVFTPISERDNNGNHLGLLEYELIIRPDFWWSPVPNLRLLVEGEHDWNAGRANTFNTSLRFGPVGNLQPFIEYRDDWATAGSILYGASTQLFGRWSLTGSSQYDLELDEVANYSASLVRNDLDWTLYFSVGFDNISENTTFNFLFEPRFGNLFARRAPRFLGNRALYGPAEPTDY